MDIIRFAIHNPVKVAVGVILMLLFGTISLFMIPIQLIPNVDEPKITIETRWVGASPQEIEREIVERQEEQLKSVTQLRKMTSSSIEGQATVTLDFFVGTDKDTALREVSDKLRQVTGYPDEVDEPKVQAADSSLNTPIAWLIFHAPNEDPAKLKDFVEDDVKPLLERAEGVAAVDIYGGREREVQIRVDADKMAAMGITFRELEQALRRQNRNISAGTIAQGKRDYTWRTLGQFERLDHIEDTVVSYRTGGPVFVRDIATVHSTHQKQYSFVRSVGEAVLALPVRRETGKSVMDVMEALKKQIDYVNKDVLKPLNKGYVLRQVHDETVYIESAIRLVRTNLLYGGALALVVLMLFLRSPSATAIVGLCIPISVIGSFMVVMMLGRTLNVVMLAGMAFAVGMVVDNAIVVLENIFRHRQLGEPRVAAALNGAREVWGAVLASTLTTMVVFLPVLFLEEEAGQLFRDIAIAISAAVALSMIVAVAVIPTVSARALGVARQSDQPSHGFVSRWVSAAVHGINGSWLSRIAVISILIAASLLGSKQLQPPLDYLPSGNQNLVFGFMLTPPGYSLEEFERMGTILEETVSPYWDPAVLSSAPGSAERQALSHNWQTKVVPPFKSAVLGAEKDLQAALNSFADFEPDDVVAPDEHVAQLQHDVVVAETTLAKAREQLKNYSIDPSPIGNFFYVSFGGTSFMGANSSDPERVKPVVNLLSSAGNRIPGTLCFFVQSSLFGQLGGSANSIELELRGQDLDEVATTAEALLARIMTYFEYPQPDPPNFNLGRPEIRIQPHRVRAAEVGLNVADVGQVVEACVNGAFIPGGFRQAGDEIDIVLRVDGAGKGTPEETMSVPIYTPTGQVIPLSSIVDVVKTTAPQQINHIEELPAVKLTIRPAEGMALETAATILEDEIIAPARQAGIIPPTVFVTAAGNAHKLDQTRAALFGRWTALNLDSVISLLTSRGFLALFVTYLLMAALFESFIYPFVIIVSVIPATVGGFAGLYLVHEHSKSIPWLPVQQFDVLTMLGFVILIGVVVNNAILIVHQALNFMREDLTPRDAITIAVRTRIRPIFMTALTSICGMLPLALQSGPGSELYKGLGSVVVGGLLVSTLFTLILVPAILSMFIDLRQMLRPTASATPAKSRISV
jgi:HAE1 family hydrophobic/amphiphilic exporter-1